MDDCGTSSGERTRIRRLDHESTIVQCNGAVVRSRLCLVVWKKVVIGLGCGTERVEQAWRQWVDWGGWTCARTTLDARRALIGRHAAEWIDR